MLQLRESRSLGVQSLIQHAQKAVLRVRDRLPRPALAESAEPLGDAFEGEPGTGQAQGNVEERIGHHATAFPAAGAIVTVAALSTSSTKCSSVWRSAPERDRGPGRRERPFGSYPRPATLL